MSTPSHSQTGLFAQRFSQNEAGAVVVFFSLMLVPMLFAIGAAIDFSRAHLARVQLQNALDTVSLSVAQLAGKDASLDVQKTAELYFSKALDGAQFTKGGVTAVREKDTVRVSASGVVDAGIMRIAGYEDMAISASSVAAFGRKTIEIALVLDNTGSMGADSKIEELKAAVSLFLKDAKAEDAGQGRIKVSIVPFDTQVNVGASLARKDPAPSWVRFGVGGFKAKDWNGCITDRDTPHDADDQLPTGAKATLYPAAKCQEKLTVMQPLTNDWSQLLETVDRMRPSGCTNITIGAQWGLNTLSPGAPLGDAAAAFGTENVEKYVIVLTDGDNTRNRFYNYCGSGRSGPHIDDSTKRMCDTIKAKRNPDGSAGIKRLFTIRVINGDRDLLTACATEGDYKEVASAAQMTPVFQQILREILQLRITS